LLLRHAQADEDARGAGILQEPGKIPFPVFDGIRSEGDVQAGWPEGRHARS